MPLNPEITIRDVPHSKALETRIRNKINKLASVYSRIMHCDVIVEQYQKHKNQGKLYNVKINITVPESQIVINQPIDEDVYVAVRDAFKAATRKVLEYSRKRRGDVKTHEVASIGKVSRVFEDEHFGFIESNGSEFYFNDDNLYDQDFDSLVPGTLVRFIPTEGAEGMKANRVCTGKHHGVDGG